MTTREFYNAIITANINDELTTHATEALAKLDASLAKRKNTVSKKAEENAPLIDRIVTEILTAEAKTASDIAAELGCTVQKASSLCRTAVAQGRAVATDVKVPKKGTQKAYTIA